METHKNLLIEAREYITNYGWRQGQYQDSDGLVCLEGSLSTNNIGERYNYGDMLAAKELLRVVTESENLAMWNDKTKRTKQEVLEALDQAIYLANEGNE